MRPAGVRVKPAPFPVPPRPSALTDNLVHQYWRVAELCVPTWYAQSRRRSLLNALIRCAAQQIPDGVEITPRSVRAVLAEWGCPAEWGNNGAQMIARALEAAPQTPATLDIDIPGRQQIIRAAELIQIAPRTYWGAPPPELRAALGTAALAAVLHESGAASFSHRDLKSAVNYECAIAGVQPHAVPYVFLITGWAPVKISKKPLCVEGDQVKNIAKLVKYAERELARWEADASSTTHD